MTNTDKDFYDFINSVTLDKDQRSSIIVQYESAPDNVKSKFVPLLQEKLRQEEHLYSKDHMSTYKKAVKTSELTTRKKGKSKSYGVLSDFEILRLCDEGLMTGHVTQKVRDASLPSYGLEPHGYTVRLSPAYMIPKDSGVIDPISDATNYDLIETDIIEIEPQQTILTSTKEFFKFPAGVNGHIYMKSTYARAGIVGMFCPIESGFEGYLTLVLHNTNKNHSVRIYTEGGIAQVQFIRPFSMNRDLYQGRFQNSQGIRTTSGKG